MKVKLTVLKSNCRSGYHKSGEVFIVDDLCPPMCHELWNGMYPSIYVLQNNGDLDHGDKRAKVFQYGCPDDCRVLVQGEIFKD